ncbi:MAG: hypothetical protein E6J88_15590, partial [Deltaproteobacteria bacterium]
MDRRRPPGPQAPQGHGRQAQGQRPRPRPHPRTPPPVGIRDTLRGHPSGTPFGDTLRGHPSQDVRLECPTRVSPIPIKPRRVPPHTGVLLLNLGGPDSLEAVEPYLVNLFLDPFLIRIPFLRGFLRRWFARWVARRRAPHARQLYSEIGGRSPIGPLTESQGRRLEEELGPGYKSYVA